MLYPSIGGGVVKPIWIPRNEWKVLENMSNEKSLLFDFRKLLIYSTSADVADSAEVAATKWQTLKAF